MLPIKYYSLEGRCPEATFLNAVLSGLAPDGGLYMPRTIPRLPQAWYLNMPAMELRDIAYCVADNILQHEIPSAELKDIVYDTFSYPVPLRRVNGDIYALELWHGPSGAYKDLSTRFLARILAHISHRQTDSPDLIALNMGVGRAGMAVARAFDHVPDVKVILLCPKGSLTRLQRAELLNMGDNVCPVEVAGSYDDCQRLIRQAISDPGMRRQWPMTVVNSINLAALLAETILPFHAYAQLRRQHPDDDRPILLGMPCGNLGSLTAAAMALRMGVPFQRLVAGTNANDTFARYLNTGQYTPARTVSTIAPHIDVAAPANLRRLLSLYEDASQMRQQISAVASDDNNIIDTVRTVRQASGYELDPHSAVALRALALTLQPGQRGIFYATASPRPAEKAWREPRRRIQYIPPSLAGLKRLLTIIP